MLNLLYTVDWGLRRAIDTRESMISQERSGFENWHIIIRHKYIA
jgi:hypothetical protein